MVFAPPLCSHPLPPTWYLANSTPPLDRINTDQPPLCSLFLSVIFHMLPFNVLSNKLILVLHIETNFVPFTFLILFSPLRYSLLPQVSHGPVPSPTHRNPHMAWAARNSPSSIVQIHNMALFLCAVCSCIFIAAQAWMPLCFEEWQSVTHGGGQAGNLYKSAKWRPAGHLAWFSFKVGLGFHHNIISLFRRHWVSCPLGIS